VQVEFLGAPGHQYHPKLFRYLKMCFPMDRSQARIRCCLQVEFGAHQVILIRSTDNFDTLPELLKDSNALTMTVPQSKVRFLPLYHIN